ncbi:MAG TPA: DUF3617 domain-containing protein [Allosphingosinicella sp.]|nr:DUF3617 domain-containing protein [Allosphingosinicella sp.]
MKALAGFGLAGPLILLAIACSAGGGGDNVAQETPAPAIAPGLWETTSEIVDVRAPDLPFEVRRRMLGPRPSARGCITAAQAGRLIAGRNCSYDGFTMRAGRLGGRMTCPGLPRPTIATMEGRYEPHLYAFAMRMETALPDGTGMTIEVRGQGRRLGDCPGGAASEGAGS